MDKAQWNSEASGVYKCTRALQKSEQALGKI